MATKSFFIRFAEMTAKYTGTAKMFVGACCIVVVWGLLGPAFGFSDTWQLVINTGTTIITFLMVFLIQNTQNREGHAIQLKLDELIRATKGAHLGLMDLEEMEEGELQIIRKKYLELAQAANDRLRQGGDDSDTPEISL